MKKIVLIVCMCISCMLYAQNESVDLFTKGFKLYENRDYNLARKYMNKVVNMSSTTPDIREKAADIISRCDDLLDASHVPSIYISDLDLNFSAEGDFKELNIAADGVWNIRTIPSWCEIVEMSKNYLRLWCNENTSKVYRSGQLVITSNGVDKTVYLYQDPGDEKKGRIFFRTSPHNAYVEVSNGMSGYSSNPLVLGIGEYAIRISKDGYETMDTIVTVSEVKDEMQVIDVRLNPLFGGILPSVLDENGMILTNVDFYVGKSSIDLTDYANSHSFDNKESVVFYGLYKDGIIPLKPGRYNIRVSASGYENKNVEIVVQQGEFQSIEIVLNSVLGKLVVCNMNDADGATIYIPELKIKALVGDTINIPIGEYQVEVRKDNYMLDDGILNVKIDKGMLTTVNASMTRMVDMYISTDVGGENIMINNQPIQKKQEITKVSLTEGEKYKVEIARDGYWRVKREFVVTEGDSIFDFRNLHMEPVDTLRLRADEPNLLISLIRKNLDDSEDYAEGNRTPIINGEYTSLNIPHGKYRLQLIRDQEPKKRHRTAYRGTINFNEKADKNIRTWLVTNLTSMRFIEITAMMYPFSEILGNLNNLNSSGIKTFSSISNKCSVAYPPISMKLLEFPIYHGISTSFAKGLMMYTNGLTMPSDLPDNHFKVIMPAISTPLTNIDFRVGGGIGQYFDVSLALSYAYYLEFDKLCDKLVERQVFKEFKKYDGLFDHYEGHELFAGVEIGSRIRYFNMYVRSGIQYLNGERRYTYSIPNANGDYKHKADGVPVNHLMFITTISVNFGWREAKGQNILRVF